MVWQRLYLRPMAVLMGYPRAADAHGLLPTGQGTLQKSNPRGDRALRDSNNTSLHPAKLRFSFQPSPGGVNAACLDWASDSNF